MWVVKVMYLNCPLVLGLPPWTLTVTALTCRLPNASGRRSYPGIVECPNVGGICGCAGRKRCVVTMNLAAGVPLPSSHPVHDPWQS